MNLLTKLTRKLETGLLNYKLAYKRSSVDYLLTDDNGNKTVVGNYRINYLNNHLVQVAEAIEEGVNPIEQFLFLKSYYE